MWAFCIPCMGLLDTRYNQSQQLTHKISLSTIKLSGTISWVYTSRIRARHLFMGIVPHQLLLKLYKKFRYIYQIMYHWGAHVITFKTTTGLVYIHCKLFGLIDVNPASIDITRKRTLSDAAPDKSRLTLHLD